MEQKVLNVEKGGKRRPKICERYLSKKRSKKNSRDFGLK